ncbi:hypothetical protein EU545_00865 [Candidatus Thorarchaeota archaeon]|nr:MAG: hypothetical protein EU545_00865 [Candidatus Thorarchaeota archaeon]
MSPDSLLSKAVARPRRTALVVLVLAMLGISVTGIALLWSQQQAIITCNDLAWAVDQGDELSFSVDVAGSESSWFGEHYSTEFNWSSGNVTMRIAELPVLPASADRSIFVSEVVLPIKLQCLSVEVPQNYSTLLVGVLSRFFLPVGCWDELDLMFEDDLPSVSHYPEADGLEYGTLYCAGQFANDIFEFSQRRYESRFPNWSTETWTGSTSAETGIPIAATYSDSNPGCTGSSYLTMWITLNP